MDICSELVEYNGEADDRVSERESQGKDREEIGKDGINVVVDNNLVEYNNIICYDRIDSRVKFFAIYINMGTNCKCLLLCIIFCILLELTV